VLQMVRTRVVLQIQVEQIQRVPHILPLREAVELAAPREVEAEVL